MKKYIQNLITIGLILLISPSIEWFSASTPTKSNTTNKDSPLYFNNDLKNNEALSQAAKDFATNPANKAQADAIVAQNGNQCWIQCAAAMDAASKSDSNIKTLNADQGTAIQKVDWAPLDATATVPGALSAPAVDCKKTPNLPECSTDNLLWVESGKLRKWDVNMQTIVEVILNIIGFLLGIAGTVAIFSLIYHAVKMQLSSGITGDSSWVETAKKWMIGAVIGFVIAISAWFLVTRVVQLFIEVS